jgi:hypothetical protein
LPPHSKATRQASGGALETATVLRLLLKNSVPLTVRASIQQVTLWLPPLSGRQISVSARPHLKAHRGKILSGHDRPGMPVHAASFIRKRRIVLETQLLGRLTKLRLIVVHEIFHFVWARLGNRLRAEYAELVRAELEANARGELGESAGGWKAGISSRGELKNYVCESFCDTAAWLYSGARKHPELTLAKRWRDRRRTWFTSVFAQNRAC